MVPGLTSGNSKPPIQSPKQQKLSKLITSFFSTVLRLLTQLTEPKLVIACLTGSARLVPYISGNRKAMKSYLKACLGLWSSPGVTANANDEEMEETRTADEDKVRLAAFLSMRKMAMSSDEGVLDLVLKVFFLSHK
jgi:nucleolar complex protein 2